MKYKTEVTINLPREKVVALFDNTNNLYKWMKGLQSFEHLSGDPGLTGATSKLVFQMGKRKMEMVETITDNSLPDYMTSTYESGKTLNIVKNSFVAAEDNKTKYISENEFQFGTIGMKIMGMLMPGAFKKQSLQYQREFKKFAESEANV